MLEKNYAAVVYFYFFPLLILGSTYDDFYCPLMVSETFVLMVLKVISKEEYLRVFTEMKCVEVSFLK